MLRSGGGLQDGCSTSCRPPPCNSVSTGHAPFRHPGRILAHPSLSSPCPRASPQPPPTATAAYAPTAWRGGAAPSYGNAGDDRRQQYRTQNRTQIRPPRPPPRYEEASPESGHMLSDSDLEVKTGLAVTWLGTNSGTPTLHRNVSCTCVRTPNSIHLVDTGEGSHRQLLASGLPLHQVDAIFITHMHGDHCFGLGAVLSLLDRVKSTQQPDAKRRVLRVFGPPGLSELVRATVLVTGLARRLELPLVVSELVLLQASAHAPRPMDKDGRVMLQRLAPRRVKDSHELASAAQALKPRLARINDIWIPPRDHTRDSDAYGLASDDDAGVGAGEDDGSGSGGSGSDNDSSYDSYRNMPTEYDPDMAVTSWLKPWVATPGLYWELEAAAGQGLAVRAAQLQHRVPCWGYVFQEEKPLERGARRRKVVILGDTVSSRTIAPLAAGCDLLSHEATFCQGMEQKARIAQHSTGWMAGEFAAAVGARHLVLTHFSARYGRNSRGPQQGPSGGGFGGNFPRPFNPNASAAQEAEQQRTAVEDVLQEAAQRFGRADRILAASDFFTVHCPPALESTMGPGSGAAARTPIAVPAVLPPGAAVAAAAPASSSSALSSSSSSSSKAPRLSLPRGFAWAPELMPPELWAQRPKGWDMSVSGGALRFMRTTAPAGGGAPRARHVFGTVKRGAEGGEPCKGDMQAIKLLMEQVCAYERSRDPNDAPCFPPTSLEAVDQYLAAGGSFL